MTLIDDYVNISYTHIKITTKRFRMNSREPMFGNLINLNFILKDKSRKQSPTC